MAGREVREYTNLSDGKDKKWGSKSGKDKTDDEDLAFKRMVAKMQEVAGERGGYLHGRGEGNKDTSTGVDSSVPESSRSTALDSDDLLYLKEQMEAEEDAERLRRRTEKRAFAAFKHKAASLVDASPAPVLPPIRVESKPRSQIRQQVLVRTIVEVKPKRLRISGPSDGAAGLDARSSTSNPSVEEVRVRGSESNIINVSHEPSPRQGRDGSGILGLAYENSDDEESDPEPRNSQGKHASTNSTTGSKLQQREPT